MDRLVKASGSWQANVLGVLDCAEQILIPGCIEEISGIGLTGFIDLPPK